MKNNFVRFVIDVEYDDWWNDDEEKWMSPTWEQVCEDINLALGHLGDKTLKVVANDVVFYDESVVK